MHAHSHSHRSNQNKPKQIETKKKQKSSNHDSLFSLSKFIALFTLAAPISGIECTEDATSKQLYAFSTQTVIQTNAVKVHKSHISREIQLNDDCDSDAAADKDEDVFVDDFEGSTRSKLN